jgi:hypothetical protein
MGEYRRAVCSGTCEFFVEVVLIYIASESRPRQLYRGVATISALNANKYNPPEPEYTNASLE